MAETPTLVLNVNDDAATRYLMSNILKRGGYEVIEASNGVDALEVVARRRPALVLLDVKLPDVSGLEVCRKIKADPAGNMLSDTDWEKKRVDFLPSDGDRDYIESLMKPEVEPGKFASWIAPPKVGIDNKPGDFEYVKLA